MKLTPNQKHNLRDLQNLVAAVRGPHATVTPHHWGAMVHHGPEYWKELWSFLREKVDQYQEKVREAATSPEAFIAEVRARVDAEVADLRAREAEDVAEIEARAERCRALLGPLPQKVKP